MTYRVLADENVERATIHYLRKLGHDVEWIGNVSALGLGVSDQQIAAYAIANDRAILTQDDDFITDIPLDTTAGVLYQQDQTLSARTVGDIVDELSRFVNQNELTLEYVSRNWLQ